MRLDTKRSIVSDSKLRVTNASPNFLQRLRVAQQDISKSFRNLEVARVLAVSDFGRQYRFLSLGRIWRSLNTFIFVMVLGVFYSTILDRELSYYLPYLASGYVIWNFLSGFIQEGMTMFAKGAKIFTSFETPLNTFAISLSLKLTLQLFIDLIPVMAIFLVFGMTPTITWLWFPVGLLLIAIAGYGAAMMLSIFNSLIRDTTQIIPSILRVGFFVTPVIWSAEMAAKRAALVTYNPFYYFLEVARAPLLGQMPSSEAYIVSSVIAAIMLVLGLIVFAFGRRSVFYVL